jgi:deoxyribose-phosphate aldolase
MIKHKVDEIYSKKFIRRKKTMANIAQMIDHTLLKPTATREDIVRLRQEAVDYRFRSVCVHPYFVPLVKTLNTQSSSIVKICTVIGFPLGENYVTAKIEEAKIALTQGADELDMVINLGALKSNDYQYVQNEIEKIREVTEGKILKVIVETCYLTESEKETICNIVLESGADYIKTSTGFGTGGANCEDVKLFKSIVGNKIGIKASGGIRDITAFKEIVEAGAAIVGTSNGIDIVISN